MGYGEIHNSTGTICKAQLRECPLEDSEGSHSKDIEGFIAYQETKNDIPSRELKTLLAEGLPPSEALEVIERGFETLPKAQKSLKNAAPVSMTLSNGQEISVTPGVIDDNARQLYRTGQCIAFAVALAEHKGGKIVLMTNGDGAVIHAFVAKNGVAEDISKTVPLKELKKQVSSQSKLAYERNRPGDMRHLKMASPRKMRKLLASNKGAFEIGTNIGNISEQNIELAESFAEAYSNNRESGS